MFENIDQQSVMFILAAILFLIMIYIFYVNNKLSNALINSKLSPEEREINGISADKRMQANVVAGIEAYDAKMAAITKEQENKAAGGKKK